MEPTSLSTLILAELKCSICDEYMVHQIFQCLNGHNICANCRSIMIRCVSCDAPLGDSRNHFLERIADCVTFPCLYHKEGCEQMLFKQKVAVHKENCFYGPNRCPWFSCESCPWQGTGMEIKVHVQEKHPFWPVDIVGGFTTQHVSILDGHRRELLFSAQSESFFRVFLIKEGEFYGYVKYLGPDKRAELFRTSFGSSVLPSSALGRLPVLSLSNLVLLLLGGEALLSSIELENWENIKVWKNKDRIMNFEVPPGDILLQKFICPPPRRSSTRLDNDDTGSRPKADDGSTELPKLVLDNQKN